MTGESYLSTALIPLLMTVVLILLQLPPSVFTGCGFDLWKE